MVFESLVVDLINRFLGDFVENLDPSQLKIGIWGGDVVLNNLNLKEGALDDLDLPVKIKAGHIGKLVLKIPWKNLYTEPVIAELDGIYALAVPNVGIKYDAEKEEKALQNAKQKKLAQIEEAKKQEAQKGQPKEEKKDTFVEKLTTQVIKNLQIRVSSIHARYEDRYTNPARPFSIGVTLQELLFQTTDENWTPCIIKEAVTQIYKLVKLDSLSVYWNSCSPLLDQKDKSIILDTLENNIASQRTKPDYQYIVRPISSVAHLRLNTKPELKEFSIPKIGLTVVFDEIATGLSKDQYDDILEMMESVERMNLLSLYRKYRPDKPLKDNANLWWHYAYSSILNETVRRRRKMWSWQHIAEHRKMMKAYREAYATKLYSKNVSAAVQKVLDDCERYLDVFSITVMRQQAEVKAAKMGAQRKENTGKGWFGGWFGGSKETGKEKKSGEIQDKFYELYTPEEKARLYTAIGYEENEVDLTYPKEYVAVKVVTKLRNVAIFLRDGQFKGVGQSHRRDSHFREPQLLKLQLKDVYSYFGQRPAARAIHLDAKVDRMVVTGTPQDELTPRIITSQTQDVTDQVYSLANLSVDTNPLDGLCDTRVRLKARPLEIIYDAVTVNKLAEFFKPPKSVQLKQFSQAAMSKFDEIKEQSASSIQLAIEHHKYTDIGVEVMSSFIIVPEGGLLKSDSRKLILDLGQLTVVSSKHDTSSLDIKADLFEEKKSKAYDRFDIRLQHIQVLLAYPSDNWQLARSIRESPLHVLLPVDILLDVQKCIFDKDPRMAKMKVSGVLPSIGFHISDKRLQEIVALAQSIPFPESAPEEEIFKGPSDLPTGLKTISTTTLVNTAMKAAAEDVTKLKHEEASAALKRLSSVEHTNFIEMELSFEVKKLMIEVSQQEGFTEVPVLKLEVESIGSDVQMRTFDMLAQAYIGAVHLQHLKFQLNNRISKELHSVGAVSTGPFVHIVNTGSSVDPDQKLLTVKYLKASKEGPDFATLYQNTEQNIHVHFSAMELLLHQGAILHLMEFANSLVPPKATSASGATEEEQNQKPEDGNGSSVDQKKEQQEKDDKEPVRKSSKKPANPNLIDMKVTAVLREFSVGICSNEIMITTIQIKGMQAEVLMQKPKTTVEALLKDITIYDPNKNTRYRQILRIEGSNVLKAGVVVYNDGTKDEKYSDMSCVDTSVDVEIGCIKVVFLNRFVSDLLGFLDNFQNAKQQMQKAGQAAAQAGIEAVQTLQETASRLGLRVQMKAPVIVVPQNSTSSNFLLLDLGHLAVTNSFLLAGQMSPHNVPAVLEKMKIVLTSFKLSRAVMAEGTDTYAECLIVDPFTLSLKMRRNLSASWYHKSPDIELSGALEPLTVRLSQGDFRTLMQVLNENLSEGQPKDSSTKTVKPSGAEKQTKTVSPKRDQGSNKDSSSTDQEVYDRIKVDFQLKGLVAVFYSGNTALVKRRGVCDREPSHLLGKFELVCVSVSTTIMSDSTIGAKISLKDLLLDDLRLSKAAGITRMMQRKKTGTSHSSEMVCLNFQQDTRMAINVQLGISRLYICLCMEFLMSLANIFTTEQAESSDSTAKPKERDSKQPPTSRQTPTQPLQSLEVLIEMENPEIILIEDQMNNNTNSLVVDMALSFRLLQTSEIQKLNAGITGLQIFSCTFDSRHKHGHQVLTPCDINVVSSAPHGRNHHIDVSVGDIVLVISPSIISTISAVSAGITASQGQKATYTREVAPVDLWDVKSLASCNFWYVKSEKPDVGEAALNQSVSGAVYTSDLDRSEEVNEQLVFSVPSIVVELEGGIGYRTVPLLILETNFWAQVRNWSSELSVEASLDIEAGYYNERRAVWEPLLEPVTKDGKTRRWALGIEIRNNNETLLGLDESMEDEEQETLPVLPSKMVINVLSSDSLQLTVTKSSLELLNNVSKAFNDAYYLVLAEDKNQEAQAPFLFVNQTGFEILLKLDPSFEPPETAVQGRVKLQADASLPVYNKKEGSGATKASLIKATQEGDERKLIFQVEDFGATREVTIKRVEKRLFQINQRSHHGDVWSIMCVTDCKVGQKIFYLTTIVQVKNSLTFPVEVFYQGDTKLESSGVAQPNSVFSLPLKAVYSLSSELFFRPCTGSYSTSSQSFNWRSAENSGLKQISCSALAEGFSACYFNIESEVEKIYFENGDQKKAKCFLYHLQPTVILHNLLPFDIKFLLQNTADQETLQKGENRPLMHACFTETTLEIVIPSYQNKQWVGRCQIQHNMPELTSWAFETGSGAGKVSLDLGLHCKLHEGTLDVTLFCPYMMINKTGRRLAYRGLDHSNMVEHTPDAGELLLFSYKERSFFGSKKKDKEDGKPEGEKKSKDKVQVMKQAGKAQLQIGNLEWSDKFSLDTVGSSGTVQCKSKTETVEVGVKIHLSSSGLTKIVTFTPYYLLLNTSRESILISETEQDNWVEVPGRECVPFWPRRSEKITVKAKMMGTPEETVPFLVNHAHTTLLRLNNDFGGIHAECQVSESSMITTLKTFSPGLACVQVINHTENKDVTFYQSGLKNYQTSVPPQHAVLYTWNDPMGAREIYWTCGNKKDEKNDLTKDGMDEFFADSDTKVYWVTFLDGMQRVLLFTQDIAIVAAAQEIHRLSKRAWVNIDLDDEDDEVEIEDVRAGELEQVDQEIVLQVQSFGLSLVNDMTQDEVAFMGITSSGVIWEEKRRRRYKALKLNDCKLLEEAFQKYQTDLILGKTPNSTVLLENKMEVNLQEFTITLDSLSKKQKGLGVRPVYGYQVDLSRMMAVKPKTFPIRRSFENGIWIQYKASAHQLQLHAKINRLQFDNQMAHPIFPTVLAPLPPPKSVAADSVPKPFMEVSFMMRKHEHSNVHQIKYFKVLVQEMSVKVSQEYLNAILDFFAANQPLPRIQETIEFGEDIKHTESTLLSVAGLSLSEEKKNFYDYLHLSPIKLHLSFSLQNSSGTSDSVELHAGVLNVFLQSVGVVLTDVQDVIFKLGYFERSHSFYNQSQLIRQMSTHYIGQAIKQMYVLVLGLDVLGNPFGLLRGLSEGIEDLFYEPYQGAIQGPEEFAEGLALGVRSLFGHTVGGAAGAVSRITGTLGKGLATLTLDEDYQKKRQAQLNQRPATAREGFARGGKGLIMGVFDGVTGVVLKPVEGARQEGVTGFFKGVGKGLVGVVTRPTSGVVDFASSSFEGIRRIAEMTDEVKRLRPPRRFFKDNVIRPYIHHEAEGFAILKETNKGKYIATDEYQAHLVVSKDGKNVFILTDKHIIMAKLGDIFGSWDCEWAYTWADLKEPPKKTSKGFEIILKEKEKKKLFSSGSNKKEVTVQDPRLVEWILPRIEEQMVRNK